METLENFDIDIMGVIATHAGVDASSISRDTHLEADLGVDSMSMAVLTIHLEPYFLKAKGELPVDYMQAFLGVETVGELIDAIVDGRSE